MKRDSSTIAPTVHDGKQNLATELDLPPLRQLQMVELEIAKKFVGFCNQHKLQYFMLGGTFLGAVRHKGFIPWDDDMDFGMYREDYEQFLLLCKTEPTPFIVRNFFNDEKNANGRYQIKIEDPTAGVRVRRIVGRRSVEMDVWIDIFPLDGMPKPPFLRFFWSIYLMWRRAAFMFSVFDSIVDVDKPNRPFLEKILISAGKCLPVERIFCFSNEIRKFDKALKRFLPASSDHVFQPVSPYKLKEIFKKDIFGGGAFYEFEGQSWRGPVNQEGYLKQLYGANYMVPPQNRDNWHKREEILIKS